jgi:hypothetical protein
MSASKKSKNKNAIAPSQKDPIQISKSLRNDGYNRSRNRAIMYDRKRKRKLS